MTLYHGSNTIIEHPDLSKCKPFKDFGQGFYLSADRQQAEEMAKQRTLIQQTGSPAVTCFLFDEQWMHSEALKVLRFEDYSEEWAAFVLQNRDYKRPCQPHDYDIVYGPIADDGVTFQLRRYQAGSITLHELMQELRYAQGITFQYFFGTERALSKLIRL